MIYTHNSRNTADTSRQAEPTSELKAKCTTSENTVPMPADVNTTELSPNSSLTVHKRSGNRDLKLDQLVRELKSTLSANVEVMAERYGRDFT